jgi:uncharacterized protein (TIGR02996 family)
MSDEQALLNAILAHPEEDTPRLVYADWLDEQGGRVNAARAEYIRLEINIARADPAGPRTPEQEAAAARAKELFLEHGTDWFPEFVGRKNWFRGRCYPFFARGFPYQIYGQSHKLIEIGYRLFQRAPITSVEFREVSDELLEKLVVAPWVAQLRTLNLNGFDLPPTDWAPLADSQYLTGALKLVLLDGVLTPEGSARIAGSNPCPKLKHLHLDLALTEEALGRLFRGPAFTDLEALYLSPSGTFGRSGVEAITTAPVLAELKTFALPGRPIRGLMKIMTKAVFWSGLRELELWRCTLGDEAVADLVGSGRCELQRLRLDNNGITGRGARTLAESPLLGGVTSLGLWGNPIGTAGVIALARSPHLKRLESLNLYDCRFGAEGARALAESPYLAELRVLNVGGNAFGVEGAKALAASPYLGKLRTLWAAGATAASKKHLRARFGAVVSF